MYAGYVVQLHACDNSYNSRTTLRICFYFDDAAFYLFWVSVVTKDDIASMGSDGARLITAASDGDKATLNSLLKAGVNVNSRDWDNLTPLLAAANQNRLDMETGSASCRESVCTSV